MTMIFRRFVPLVAVILLGVLGAPGVSAQATEVRAGRSVRGTLAEGDTAVYTVSAAEDFFVFGEVDQLSVDVVVRFLDPAGNQRGRVDGPARGVERFVGETSEAGIHTIQVIPAEGESGEYEITLIRLEPLATEGKKLAEQLMARYDGEESPGAAIQVWQNGRTIYSDAWGMANLAYGIPFETDTRTNIGSTSKQFTAFAIMLQAERGALSLSDDIRKHVPEVPDFGETVTIEHLITHTSGLREVFNLLLMTGRRIDHGDYVSRDEVIDVVRRQPALQNAPGAEWNYNNTAFALAALIVERTSGQTFPDFLHENVFAPLGMTRTMVRPDAEAVVPGRSQGYAPGAAGFIEIRDLGAAMGAGGIYSTVGDLQRWAENVNDPVVGSREIFDAMMTSYVLTDGEETGYGYGLSVDEQGGAQRVHHGGADVAHRSMLAWYPELNAGITTQSNHAAFDSNVAFRLAAAFFPDGIEDDAESGAMDEAFDPASYDPEAFDDFAGRYALDAAPTFILTFSRDGSTFFIDATGQERVEIVPASDSTFTLTVVDASIVFHRNESGDVDALTLRQNGEQRATRLEGDAAVWEPTEDDLADFEGRFFSEEIETFFTLVVEDGALIMKHRRLDDATLEAGDHDIFSGGGLTLAFERDRSGTVIGFYLDNQRSRDVRFERIRR